jgi:hypothetical protein
MPFDAKFVDAANKVAELQRAWEAGQWEWTRLALELRLTPIGQGALQAMPRVEQFPVAPQPR